MKSSGASNGRVWVFDSGFCDTSTSAGTGENWTVGGSNGAGTPSRCSSFFVVYDTNNTPYDVSDDAQVGGFGNDYRQSLHQDLTARQGNVVEDSGGNPVAGMNNCRGNTWHDSWVQIASGLAGGKTYRSTRSRPTRRRPPERAVHAALNTFALRDRSRRHAAGLRHRRHGGATFRLPGGVRRPTSTWRSIEDVHRGQDPRHRAVGSGRHGRPSASLEELQPTTGGYTPATFSYTAATGSTASGVSSCNTNTGTNVTAVTTNTGGSSLFNGCWLTINIALPSTYAAPHPSTDTTTTEGGWWRCKYTMGGEHQLVLDRPHDLEGRPAREAPSTCGALSRRA